jgi:hypothetical protein
MNTSKFNIVNPFRIEPLLTQKDPITGRVKMRHILNGLGLILLNLSFASCELYTQDDYEPYYVVEAYLIESNSFPAVRLSTTAASSDFYRFDDYAVENATIAIHLLRDIDLSIEQTISYSLSEPGIYLPSASEFQVLPGRLYQLEASIPGYEQLIRAATRVPNRIEIIEAIQDTVIYQSEEQIELTVSSEPSGENQSVFVFNSIALDTLVENLTPFYRSLFEDDPIENSLSDLSQTSSGTLNEGNFIRNPDGTITLVFPWIGVSFYENNQVICNVIDQNLYDLLRSQSVQLGGSTLSPGEIQNAIYNIEGAIGIFGSLSSDTVSTYILPNPAFF